ncbi:MAG: excinuclease ABC subunit UvrC [Candidatus Omnitrophota bacterium]|nr:excinuclease ABC subunit UvrC [Candidatus Omnitrophota bacterium]
MVNKLKDKIKNLPESPGVYMFKDAEGKVIYIGKAKSLKKRVQSYFVHRLDSKTQTMLSKVACLDYVVTSSEAQAQILEAALIKERQPQYNIDLKDDKSFPWIRITEEEFPVVSICRRKKRDIDDNSLYFGPYTNAKLLRQALKIMRRIFGFRSCKKIPRKACLYWRVNLCPGPCIERIGRDSYREIIERIKMFLESRYARLIEELSRKMNWAAEDKEFEEAAKIRDQINALSAIAASGAVSSAINELEEAKSALKLEKLPLRIEAFDISNISGKEACGSMVSFYAGASDKNNYRRFRIKTVEGIDDYKMLAEVVRRRYLRIMREKTPLPDLILIDGGRGHLSAAKRVLEGLGIDLPLISIAKEEENIYINDRLKPLRLARDCVALNLIRRIRDEAHRFAVSYHHILRRKRILGK